MLQAIGVSSVQFSLLAFEEGLGLSKQLELIPIELRSKKIVPACSKYISILIINLSIYFDTSIACPVFERGNLTLLNEAKFDQGSTWVWAKLGWFDLVYSRNHPPVLLWFEFEPKPAINWVNNPALGSAKRTGPPRSGIGAAVSHVKLFAQFTLACIDMASGATSPTWVLSCCAISYGINAAVKLCGPDIASTACWASIGTSTSTAAPRLTVRVSTGDGAGGGGLGAVESAKTSP